MAEFQAAQKKSAVVNFEDPTMSEGIEAIIEVALSHDFPDYTYSR
jgi:hypothetical protein